MRRGAWQEGGRQAKMLTVLFYTVAVAVVAIDQAAKLWIRFHLVPGGSLELVPSYLKLTYYENSGAARSTFQGYARWFGAAAVVFVAAVLIYRHRNKRSALLETGLSLLVGGAAGNAIDRLALGKVTDFLIFGSSSGVLNLADLAINAGILCVLLDMLFRSRKQAA